MVQFNNLLYVYRRRNWDVIEKTYTAFDQNPGLFYDGISGHVLIMIRMASCVHEKESKTSEFHLNFQASPVRKNFSNGDT